MTDRERMEDVGFMTCMTLVLLGNYAQTGHFGGPLAYTPFNVATHLAGPRSRRAALRLSPPQASVQRQVHAGRRATARPTCYALWMIMGEALDAEVSRRPAIAAITSRPMSRCCRSTRSASAAAPAR